MGTMEAIKRGFGVAAKCLKLVVILILFNLVWNLVSIPLAPRPGQVITPQLTLPAVIFSIIFILLSIFVQGGVLGLIKDHVKGGGMKLKDFASYGLKYYLRLLGLGLLIVLIVLVIALIAALIIAATTPLNNAVVTVIATIIAIAIGAVGLYFVLLLIMSPYSLVCEEKGVVESMKTSVRVVRKSIGKVLLLLVLLILISLGIGFLIGLVTGVATVALPAKTGQIITGVIGSIFNGYLGVVMTASFMVFYLALTAKEKPAA